MNSGIYILVGSFAMLVGLYLYFSKRKPAKPKSTCSNCEFCTPYQMLNNRDERVDVNHCSVLSSKIKSIHGGYLEPMAVSIDDTENFSCSNHKLKDRR